MNITKKYIEDNFIQNGRFNGKKLNSSNLGVTNEEIYLIYHNIEKPICPVCGGFTPYFGFKRGYQKTCSIKCSKNLPEFKIKIKPRETEAIIKKFISDAPLCGCGNPLKKMRGKLIYRDSCGDKKCNYHKAMVKIKREKTNMEKYGVKHISQIENIKLSKKIKMLKYNITNDYFDIDKEIIYKLIKKFKTKKEDKNIYYAEVDKYTRINKPIDGIGLKYNTHLDHKFSKFMGFILNIPPFIIGSKHNLEIIPSYENVSKSISCSISQTSLYEAFYGS